MNEVKLIFFNHIVVGQSMVFYELIFLIDTFEVSRREQSIANLSYILYKNGDKNGVVFYISYKMII